MRALFRILVCSWLSACAEPPPDRDAGERDAQPGEREEREAGPSEAAASDAGRSDASTSAHDADVGMGGHTAGAFPFPQNRDFAHCMALETDDTQLSLAWEKWKKQAIVSEGAGGFLRVRRWENADDTVSEGISYGMLAAVYFNDQATFDPLFQYSQLHLDGNGLMHWRLDAQGRALDGNGNMVGMNQLGAATDADEDIAWALIMAHYQWGGRGALQDDYIELARALIDKIYRFEVDHAGGGILKPGDTWGGASITNPSYFAPAYYRTFGRITGKVAEWNKVIDATYKTLAASAHASTGLVPAWCKADGSSAGREYYYQYDACRTPFRIALDYCLNGEPRAEAYLKKVGAFFQGIGASGIRDGYELNGASRSRNTSAAFSGPAGVAGMIGGELRDLAKDVYTELLVLGQQQPGQGYSYYNSSWHLLSLLMLSGNYLDFSIL